MLSVNWSIWQIDHEKCESPFSSIFEQIVSEWQICFFKHPFLHQEPNIGRNLTGRFSKVEVSTTREENSWNVAHTQQLHGCFLMADFNIWKNQVCEVRNWLLILYLLKMQNQRKVSSSFRSPQNHDKFRKNFWVEFLCDIFRLSLQIQVDIVKIVQKTELNSVQREEST